MGEIIDVWDSNLDDEFATIEKLVRGGKIVAGLDTEYPGIVFEPLTTEEFKKQSFDARYSHMAENVNRLEVIQIGIAVYRRNSESPPRAWQFNVKDFDMQRHNYSESSITLLRNSGIDLQRNRSEGVEGFRFLWKLLCSGLLTNPNVEWCVFQGGYDIAFILRLILRKTKLPSSRSEFLKLMSRFFPVLYDVKRVCFESNAGTGGLQKMADKLQCRRVGQSHQSASDSLLTLSVFITLKETIPMLEKYRNKLAYL